MAQHGSVRYGTAQNGTAWCGTAQLGSAWLSRAHQSSVPWHSSAQHGTEQLSTHGMAWHGTVQHGTAPARPGCRAGSREWLHCWVQSAGFRAHSRARDCGARDGGSASMGAEQRWVTPPRDMRPSLCPKSSRVAVVHGSCPTEPTRHREMMALAPGSAGDTRAGTQDARDHGDSCHEAPALWGAGGALGHLAGMRSWHREGARLGEENILEGRTRAPDARVLFGCQDELESLGRQYPMGIWCVGLASCSHWESLP